MLVFAIPRVNAIASRVSEIYCNLVRRLVCRLENIFFFICHTHISQSLAIGKFLFNGEGKKTPPWKLAITRVVSDSGGQRGSSHRVFRSSIPREIADLDTPNRIRICPGSLYTDATTPDKKSISKLTI